MRQLRVLYQLARADLLERTRRSSFLVTLGAIVYLGYLVNAGTLRLKLDQYQGELNAAWIGGVMATIATFFLSLFGFFLVRNAIDRDEHTGVGQIIATTPLGKFLYIAGKALSNFLFLIVPVAILVLAAFAMQVLQGNAGSFDIGALVAPFLGVVLPALVVTAALAVLFETISWLRGAVGAIVYITIWTTTLSLAFLGTQPLADWSGTAVIWQSMAAAVRRQFPDYSAGFNITFTPPTEMQTFKWTGIVWTPDIVLGRLLWVGVALGLVFVASLLFNRFDPSRVRPRRKGSTVSEETVAEEVPEPAEPYPLETVGLSALASRPRSAALGRALIAELRILLKGQHWWWYGGVAVLVLGGLFSPLAEARSGWLVAAWIWPLALWSGLGVRELRYRTQQIIFSSAHPLLRQFPATWMAGFAMTALIGGGVAVRLLAAGDWSGLTGWLAGALFIPSLALALGVWSGSGRLFEVVYIVLWYIGPLQGAKAPGMDFLGATDASVAAGTPERFLAAAGVLLIVALAGRWRQLRS